MKYFIDLGCHSGDTIQQFCYWSGLIAPYNEFEIFGFDPLSKYKQQWQDMTEKNKRLHFYSSAVWIKDGEIEFNQRDGDYDVGSSIMPTKKDWDLGSKESVTCIDFSKWLSELIKPELVIVKMDIEGAEYKVLQKMIDDGTDKLVDKLFVEWHRTRLTDYDPALEKEIIKKLHCEVYEWL